MRMNPAEDDRDTLHALVKEVAELRSDNDGLHRELLITTGERDEARSAVERVRELHRPQVNLGTCRREDCPCRLPDPYCSCSEGHEDFREPWPCPTLRALGGAA